MDLDDTTTVGGAAPAGLPPQPEGEGTNGHARTRRRKAKRPGEASPPVLANPDADASTRTTTASGGVAGTAPPAVVEEEYEEIVRATAKLRINPKLIPDWGGKTGLQSLLYDVQREVARAMNLTTRGLWAHEGAALDEFMLEHGRAPKGDEWPRLKQNDFYHKVRKLCPDMPSGMASLVAKTACTKWWQTRFDTLIRQKDKPPHYRDTVPVPLRAQELRVMAQTDGSYLVSFPLRSGRGQTVYVPIVPKDGYQRQVLKKIADGEWKYGNALLSRDRKNRWHLRLSYKRRVKKKAAGQTAALNRGIRVFLACITEDGKRWLYDGHDIVAYLKQLQARRREYQYSSNGSGRSGRGRKRMLRPIEHLSGKGERWRETKCQTVARRLVKWLDERGVKTLCIENFTGIRESDLGENEYIHQLIQEWPYYQLEQRIRSCCAEVGIQVVTLQPEYISQRCPKCGYTHEKNRNLKKWLMDCGKCGHKEHLDVSAARILLAEREDRRIK